MVSCPPCTRDHPYIGVDPYFRGEGGGSASATLPPPNRAQIPTGGGWAAERSRLEIFMYWCNAREYLLLYEAFMLIIDYLFSERIFFNAGDRSYGFSPEWKFLCAFKCCLCLKDLSHLWQAKGFSPVWFLLWIFRSPCFMKKIHTVCKNMAFHLYGFFCGYKDCFCAWKTWCIDNNAKVDHNEQVGGSWAQDLFRTFYHIFCKGMSFDECGYSCVFLELSFVWNVFHNHCRESALCQCVLKDVF